MDDRQQKPVMKEGCLALRENTAGTGLLLAALGLICLGVVAVYSALATVQPGGTWYARVDFRHILFACLAVVVLVVGWRVNYRILAAGRGFPWPAGVLLLVAMLMAAMVFVPGVGHAVGGRYRWIRVGPENFSLGFQPSELLKLSLVIFLACWLTRSKTNPRRFRTVLLAGVVSLLCAALVVTQDFGTAALILLSAAVTMFIAGVPWWYFAATIPPALLAGWWYMVSEPYRMRRIQAVLDPWSEANPSAYQARQSIIAVLGGGWHGAGLGQGVRKLGFLPEDSTDFLFASFCEEWGYRGAALVMGLLLLWLLQCRKVSGRAGDSLGRVLAASLGAMIAIQAMLHIGVNLVVLPPTGISLPFLSAGGTSLLLMAAATALIASVSARPAAEALPSEQP